MSRFHLDCRVRAFALAVWLAALGLVVFGAGSKMTLRGKLYATEQEADNGLFFLDPDGESESISVVANAGGIVADYLHGSVGRTVVITIEPQ